MNWIDSWGDFTDPNIKDPSADLEMQIQNSRMAPTFEEMEKPEANIDRFVSLALSDPEHELKITAPVDNEILQVKIDEKALLPRASQIAYGKNSSGEKDTAGGVNTKNVKRNADNSTNLQSKPEAPLIQEKDKEGRLLSLILSKQKRMMLLSFQVFLVVTLPKYQYHQLTNQKSMKSF